ncbi:MAG: alpha-L-fucosidase [Ignavibacteriaceae bacterium]|nr:alpha-L-fucosidase [Ignavibacteriaceae bacterium]
MKYIMYSFNKFLLGTASNIITGFFVIIFILCTYQSLSAQAESQQVLPTKSQVKWADAEIGVIIHLDINIYTPDSFDYNRKETLPQLSVFNPSKLNTDQWIKAAKAAGATYAILVAKHGTGFSLWPTKAHPYNISNTPFKNGKGDVAASFIKSCKKYGLRYGFYCSTNSNTYYGVHDNPFILSGDALLRYNNMVLHQLTELWTNYGKLFEIWFDGGVTPNTNGGIADEVEQLVKKYQPEAILFQGPLNNENLIRWVGNEEGIAPYPMWSRTDTTTSSNGQVEIKGLSGNPDGKIWCPAESDFPNRNNKAWQGGWLWKAGQENYLLSANELVDKYYKSVGRNTNMLIGMAIDTSGQFPQEDAKLFADFGKEIKKRFGKSIAETNGSGKEITLTISSHPVKINHVIIMEDIAKGENIRKYMIEAWKNGKWQKIVEGVSVGHKVINQFEPISTTKIRLSIIESSKPPCIKKLSVYYVQ